MGLKFTFTTWVLCELGHITSPLWVLVSSLLKCIAVKMFFVRTESPMQTKHEEQYWSITSVLYPLHNRFLSKVLSSF